MTSHSMGVATCTISVIVCDIITNQLRKQFSIRIFYIQIQCQDYQYKTTRITSLDVTMNVLKILLSDLFQAVFDRSKDIFISSPFKVTKLFGL